MARGWESKSVEAQMDTAKEPPSNNSRHSVSDAEKKARREREGLTLVRARIQQQLEAATNERYKELLRQELGELEKRINTT
jgi:hypothetical protein